MNEELGAILSQSLLSTDAAARVLENAKSLFLQEPDAVFTLAHVLGRDVRKKASAAETLCQELSGYLEGLIRRARAVDPAPLRTALDAALSASLTPGVQATERVIGKVDLAARALAAGVSSSAGVTASREEAVDLLFAGLSTLLTSVEDIEDKLRALMALPAGLRGSALVASLTSTRVARVVATVEDLVDTFDSATETLQSLVARESVVRLAAASAALQPLAKGVQTDGVRLRQYAADPVRYRLSAAGQGTPAKVIGTKSAPWPLTNLTADLAFDINGAADFTNVLGGSGPVQAADVVGVAGPYSIASNNLMTPYAIQSVVQPYVITAGVDDQLYIEVDGKVFTVTLPAGAAVTAAQVVTAVATDPGVVADPRVTASVVTNMVRLSYSNPSPPSRYSDRYISVNRGAYCSLALEPYAVMGPGTPAGTVSYGKSRNNSIPVNPNDSPAAVSIALPAGVWPTYAVNLGDTVTPGTVVYAIDQAAIAAGEDFSAESSGGKLRIFSTLTGEGSEIVVGIPTSSSQIEAAKTLGLYGASSVQRDIFAEVVVAAIRQNAVFAAQARVSGRRTDLFVGDGTVTAGTEVTVTADPTGWPSYDQVKVVVVTSQGNVNYYDLVAPYTFVGGSASLALNRRVKAGVGSAIRVTVYRQPVEIESVLDDESGYVLLSDTATAVLGLTTSLVTTALSTLVLQEYRALSASWYPANASLLGLKVEDLVLTESGTQVASVTAVTPATGELSTAEFFAVGDTVSYFSIVSASAARFDDMCVSLSPFTGLFTYVEGVVDLCMSVARAAKSGTASVQVALACAEQMSTLATVFGFLNLICGVYSPVVVRQVETVLALLEENGLDRARALLLSGDFVTFAQLDVQSAIRSETARQATGDALAMFGEQKHGVARSVWVDAFEQSSVFDDIESSDSELAVPVIWGDEDV